MCIGLLRRCSERQRYRRARSESGRHTAEVLYACASSAARVLNPEGSAEQILSAPFASFSLLPLVPLPPVYIKAHLDTAYNILPHGICTASTPLNMISSDKVVVPKTTDIGRETSAKGSLIFFASCSDYVSIHDP